MSFKKAEVGGSSTDETGGEDVCDSKGKTFPNDRLLKKLGEKSGIGVELSGHGEALTVGGGGRGGKQKETGALATRNA